MTGAWGKDLFFSTSGKSTDEAGFYGGHLISSSGIHGDYDNLFENSYGCAYHGNQMKQLFIQSISLDPISQQILLSDTSDDHLTLVSSKICMSEPHPTCMEDTTKVLFYEAELSAEKVGPFAMYNNDTYFLLNHQTQADTDHKAGSKSSSSSVFELRKLTGCEESYPVDSSSTFDVTMCSSLVSTLSTEESKTGAKHDVTYIYGDTLLAVPSGQGEQPSFFALQCETTDNGSPMNSHLTLVYVDSHGRKFDLDTQNASINLRSLGNCPGGISYKDGKLCWSVIDQIRCAEWNSGSGLTKVHFVLDTGPGKDVCKKGEYSFGSLSYSKAHIEALSVTMPLMLNCK